MTDLRSAPVPDPGEADHARGPADGAVVVMYADFTCPRCALAWERVADAPLRLVFRHLALKAKHPRAVALACAAEAAAAQGAFWPFAEAVYADPGRIDDPHLWARCEALGLDVTRFEADRRDAGVLARVKRDVTSGLRAGVTVTPTFFTGSPPATAHPGPPDAATVAAWAGRADVPGTG